MKEDKNVKSLIIIHSYYRGNTAKVADAIAGVLGAEVKKVTEVFAAELKAYDLIGFGAGIDGGRHYKELLAFAASLPAAAAHKAFIFSTAGICNEKKTAKDHKPLRDVLLAKGYVIINEFGCHGYDARSVLKLFGGLNKGRPDEADLRRAADFARTLFGNESGVGG
jgi:flavodoxin